ncbi:MAG: hypothetical protein SPI15_12930 [Candidatus Faecousia sp.]|nr:hypothetical protein [Clostridiales bacterium]MDY6181731.1 hypothetical protein [Candidatus Faecousia sp.]
MQKLKITDRKKLVELIEQIPVQNIISMEVETYRGSYLEGINWDFLKYVYNREKDTNESPGWIDYTIAYKDSISPDSLVSDFDDIQNNGTCGSKSIVTVIYDEER